MRPNVTTLNLQRPTRVLWPLVPEPLKQINEVPPSLYLFESIQHQDRYPYSLKPQP